MSAPPPISLDDLSRFDALIDSRSPSEFALDHLPGAINCPVLDDDERRIVGTIYKQTGAFEARRVGAAMAASNIARHLREQFANQPVSWKPLVYCWRGGQRSGSMVTIFRAVGWDAQQLNGGYKRWRRHVIDTIDRIAPQLPLQVLCGATGSAKTRVLQALAALGEQVLDLEGLACHKGSLLGHLPGRPQPSQKAFENQLAVLMRSLNLNRPVWIEAESRKIGRIALPTTLVERMRASPCHELVASHEARVDYLLRDYAYVGDDGAALADRLAALRELHGKEVITRWQDWATTGQLRQLSDELIRLHYDPAYARSQAAHFHQWATRQPVESVALDDAGITALAGALRARCGQGLLTSGPP